MKLPEFAKLICILLLLPIVGVPLGANAQYYSWSQQSSGGDNHEPRKIAIDRSGDVLTTGSMTGPAVWGGVTYNGGINWGMYIAKNASDGTEKWFKTYSTASAGSGYIYSEGITADPSNDIIVVGAAWDTLVIDGDSLFPSWSLYTAFILKLDPNGNKKWVKKLIASSSVILWDVETDAAGNIYVVGEHQGSVIFGTDTLVSAGQFDGFVAKFDGFGNYIWSKALRSSGFDRLYDIEISDLGILAVAGYYDQYSSPKLDGIALPIHGMTDAVVARFSLDGTLLWHDTFGGSTRDRAGTVAIDGDGNVFTSGYFNNTMGMHGSTMVESDPNGIGLFLVKYDSTGNYLWHQSANGQFIWDKATVNEFRSNLCVDTAGNSYLSASATTYINCPPYLLSDTYWMQAVSLMKYDPDGELVHFSMDSTQNVVVNAMAVSDSGKLFITGQATMWQDILLFCYNAPSNLLKGVAYMDANGNGAWDAGETPLEEKWFSVEPLGLYALTDDEGRYSFAVDTGTFQVKCKPHDYSIITQPSVGDHYNYYLPGGTAGLSVTDTFGVMVIPNVTDLVVALSNLTPPRPGFAFRYLVSLYNNGTDTLTSFDVRLCTDSLLTFITSEVPASGVMGDTATWAIDTLEPDRSISFWVEYSVPSDVGLLGDTVVAFLDGTDVLTDTTLSDNLDTLPLVIVGAYDPNDKAVHPMGTGPEGYIDAHTDHLTYTIRFQNTGTAMATRVAVHDKLPDGLDVTSLKVMGVSHPYVLAAEPDGQLNWIFDNINLPDSGTNMAGSMGYIVFSVDLKPGLDDGTILQNDADIYFDFNPEIVTNTVTNTIVDTTSIHIVDPGFSSKAMFFPNPVAAGSMLGFKGDLPQEFELRFCTVSGALLSECHVNLGELAKVPANVAPHSLLIVTLWDPNGTLLLAGKLLVE